MRHLREARGRGEVVPNESDIYDKDIDDMMIKNLIIQNVSIITIHILKNDQKLPQK